MAKFFMLVVFVGIFCVAAVNTTSAQVAVEYGVIGSKTSPTCIGCSKKTEKKIQNNVRRAASSNKVYKSEPKNKSQAAGKNSGPLIIEKRGDHYERIH